MSQASPPGPTGAPFIGSLIPFLKGQLEFLETCAEYGDVVHRNVMGNESYLLFHPDHIEEVMVDKNDKFKKQPNSGNIGPAKSCGNPMMDPDATPWDVRYRNMNPAFKREVIDDYVDVIARTTDERIESFASGGPVDVWPEMKKLTLGVTMKTLFGEERVERLDPERVIDAYSTINSRLNTKRQIVPSWAPVPLNWRMKKDAEYLFGVIEDMVESAREDGRESDSLLSVMLAAAERENNPIPTSYLKRELLTLLVAAQETSALGITYIWQLVARHPDVQRRLTAEAEEVLGDDGMATKENVRELPYTTKVIKESLRLYPSVFHSSREAKEDVTFDGYRIPKGAQIYMPQWVVQRDERWYDDPDEFRPERWDRERTLERPDFSYFPFSGGPKQCIGRTFAMVEFKAVLSMFMKQTDVELLSEEEPELNPSVTLTPKNPIELLVKPSS
jgi:cytochrome P450